MRYVYKIIPVPVITTNAIPERFGALSLGVVILIRPAQCDNKALITHELVHAC